MKDNFKKPNIDFKAYKDFKVRISQVPPLDVAFNTMALSEYELLVATIYKLNELIKNTNSYTELINEIMIWVVNDGLEQSVNDQLNIWLNDGTLETIINDTLFTSKLDKEDFNEFVTNIYEVFVNDLDVRLTDLENDLTDVISSKADKVWVEELEKTTFKHYAIIDDVIKDETLKENDLVFTTGYHEIGDGGGNYYKVVKKNKELFIGVIHNLDNGLQLEHLIVDDYLNIEFFGIKEKENVALILNEVIEYTSKNRLRLIINKDYDFSGKNIFVRSNSHITINGELKSLSTPNALFETFDRVNPTPEHTASNNIIFDGSGIVNMNANGYGMELSDGSPFRIHHAKNVLIKDITILDINKDHAIEAGGTDGLTIKNVTFNGNVRNDPNSWRYGESIQIEQSGIGAGGALPYDQTPTKNVLIEDCKFISSGNGTIQTGIGSHGIPEGEINRYNNIMIRNNYFEGVVASCITPCAWSDVTITGNTARKCKMNFIGFINYNTDSIDGGLISNNTFSDFGRKVTDANAPENMKQREYVLFNIKKAKNLIIENNVLNKSKNGLALIVNSEYVKIKDNMFYDYAEQDNETVGGETIGVFVLDYPEFKEQTNIFIQDNIFVSKSNTHDRPIHFSQRSYNWTSLIRGNTFRLQIGINPNDLRNMINSNKMKLFEGKKSVGDVSLSGSVYNFKHIVVEVNDSYGWASQHIIDRDSITTGKYVITLGIPNATGLVVRIHKLSLNITESSVISIVENVTTINDGSTNRGEVAVNDEQSEVLSIVKVYGIKQ